ncbi:MAG: hypothetical protein Q9200_003534 [Gallowayella weberi]
MPSDPLSAVEKGFGEVVGAQNSPTSSEGKTESSTIASSRKEGFSQSITMETFPEGFPRLACFLDSDDSFMLFKRFGIVFSRLLLNKQDEIRQMEAELLGMDKTDEKYGGELYLQSPYEDTQRDANTIPRYWSQTRPQLLQKLETKILEYSELLLKAHQLKSLEKPSARDYRSVLHYMENDGGQIPPSPPPPQPIPTTAKGHLANSPRKKETNARTENKAIHYYDRCRISKCVTFLITILILILLMIPIWLLYKSSVNGTIGKTSDTIVLILAFTLIFSAALSAFTKAKRHEIVAASAG